jgi:hypothetical protein
VNAVGDSRFDFDFVFPPVLVGSVYEKDGFFVFCYFSNDFF